jgi:hypothetical protein
MKLKNKTTNNFGLRQSVLVEVDTLVRRKAGLFYLFGLFYLLFQ